MASEESSKKLRVIKRLDFENCVFSGVKTRAKCKRRLRARYFKDVESFDKNAEAEDLSSPTAFASPVKTLPVVQEESSPILLTKKSGKKKTAERSSTNKSSPVFRSKAKFRITFRSKRKINFGTQSPEASTTPFDISKSPVFKRSKFITEKSPATPLQTKIKVGSRNLLKQLSNHATISQEIKSFEGGKFQENSYRIEESSLESKHSLHISSFSSSEVKIPSSQICPLDAQIDAEISSSSQENANDEENEKSEFRVGKNSPPHRKNLKKSFILARLHTILQKQDSERLLRQHQDNRKFFNFEKLSLLHFWAGDANFVLKCLSSPPESEIQYLVVDKKLVPNIHTLKKASLIRLYPPWQKMNLGEEKVNVLLNVLFLEILGETTDFVLPEERTFESIPPDQFEDCEDDLLFNAFSSSYISPFLL